jgi:hypothetical protein
MVIGAVLIKNYASLDKNEKSSRCFFLKSLPIKVLQKFCTYSKEPKRNQRGTKEEPKRNRGTEEEPKREPKLPSLANFAQQLIHQN